MYVYIYTRWGDGSLERWIDWKRGIDIHVKTSLLCKNKHVLTQCGIVFWITKFNRVHHARMAVPFWRVGWSVVQCQALAFDMTDVFNPKRVYAWGLDSEEHDQLQATLEPWPFRCIHSKNRVSHSECIYMLTQWYFVFCAMCVYIYIYYVNGSSDADCNCRYSQASGAFRSLFPVLTNPALPVRRRL